MGLTECRTIPLAPARPARPGGNIEVWCDGVRVARVRPRKGGGCLLCAHPGLPVRCPGRAIRSIMAMGRLEAHSHEAMDRSKASDRSGKGLYGLLYQPNPCLGPCVVRLRVGEGQSSEVGVCLGPS